MSSEAGVGSLKEREKEIKPSIKPAKDGRYSVTHSRSVRSLPNFGTGPNNTILPAMPKIEIERESFFFSSFLSQLFSDSLHRSINRSPGRKTRRRIIKMSVIDILFRVDEVCKRYEKYDIEKQRELNAYGDDAFAHQFAAVEAEIESTINKAEIVAMETNRASVAAKNAEIRRIKARLMDEVPKLAKLAKKKVKGLSKEEQVIRVELVLGLPERIQAIPDGTSRSAEKGWAGSASNNNIKFDTSDAHLHDEFFQESEESSAFRQEYEMRKLKQDQGLDIISEGLDVLKNLAHDMNEELDRQVPLIDEIDNKVDKANSDLRNTNVRLKKTLVEIRSSRNFCIDVVLLCVLLGIASYIYNILN